MTAAEKPRTPKQNNALNLYLRQLAEALNAAGWDMKTVLKPSVEIPWNQDTAKEFLWRPIQKVMTDIESTADLDTRDVNAIYEVLDRHIAAKFGVHVEFPSVESQVTEAAGWR